MREIGSFSDWTAVPLEAVDGDVVVVRGQRFVMMGGRWHPEIPMPGYGDKPLPPAGVVPPPMPPGPAAGHRHPHVVDHYGDLRVHGDVAIGGKLRVQEIRQPNMGLFKNYESLVRRYPHPCVGMWAVVGDSVPGRIYRCERDGYWLDTGTTGGGGTFDVDEVRTEVEEALGAYDKDLSDLQSALNNEAEVRQGGDMALQARVAGLQATDDELKKIVRGDESVANAWKNPFVDLGNYATQGEVNAKLNSVYHSNDIKYNGLLRISRNGAVMQVSQHGIKTTGDEWYWAQCVAGMVQPSGDGTALDARQKFGICVRWTDYLGNATPWQTYAGGSGGDIQLKTINGQSLKGEGNIEISAEGSITIDDVVSETSANAVSSRAVAHAIADVVNALQALVSSVRSDVSALDGRVSALEAGSAGDVEAIRAALNALQATYEAKMILVDADIQQLKTRTQNVRLCVGAFVGSVASANVMGASSPSQGEIVFVQNDGTGSPQFSMRVPQSGGGYTYFNNWDGASAFKTYENTATWWKPREDSVYIDTASDKVYTYDAATMSLKQVTGGSVEADTTLDINSKNAVANSAVSRVLDTQQTAITNLQADIARIDRQGVPSQVQGDEVTVSGNADGGSAKVRLADIKTTEVRGESQEVVKVRSVGTTHVTDASMPSGSGAEARMRYKLYNDVTAGNNGAGVITLAAGSKLEPAGGVPGKTYNGQGEQITVEGGELSWVHSSDIGMIQDGQLPSGMTRAQVGAHNADVLRMVAASRWNLILDGMYYVDVQIAAEADRETLSANAVVLRRPLRIQGGGLIAARYLFCVEAGGGLVLENVTLDNLVNYAMIYMDPWGGLIESVELHGCTLKTSAAPIVDQDTGELYDYAWVGRFIGGTGKNAGHVDTVNDLTPNGIPRKFSKTSGVRYLGLPSYTEGGKSNWGLKDATSTTPTQNYCYNKEWKPSKPVFPGDDEANWDDAWCCYDQDAQLYVPYAAGAYVFRQRAASTTKHKGMAGDFVLKSDTDESQDVYYQENGEVVKFTPIYLKDDLVNGVLELDVNPAVQYNGMRRFIVDGCSIMSHSPVFIFAGMEILDEYRISNNLFYDIGTLAMNLGTANDLESYDDWNARSCPLEVYGNTFRGAPVAQYSKTQPYAGIVLYEGGTVLFHDNVVENLISNSNTYDCYLSCAKLEYRRNIFRNLLKITDTRKLYGYFKAKGARVGHNYDAKYGGDKMNHPMKLSRLFEDNYFSVNLKDVRQICDKILQRKRAAWLPDYASLDWEDVPQEAKDAVLQERVLKTVFDNVVSPWSFDTFTVRNNVFDMPDCVLNGNGASGGSVKLRRFVFSGNVMKFRGYCNTPANDYMTHLFVLDPIAGSGEVEIVGNRFESTRNEIINLLCIINKDGLKKLQVEDNEFVNCGYRLTQRPRTHGGKLYDGVIVADSVRIRGNEEGVGLDRGFTGDYAVHSPYFYQYALPSMVCDLGGEEDVMEYTDSQARGVAAGAPRTILLPLGKGQFVLRSKHLCRPMPVDAEGKAVIGTDRSLALINSFGVRNADKVAPDSKGYAIHIRYCVKGMWKEKKMELRCVPYRSVFRGVSVRGVDGRRWVHSRPYNLPTGVDSKFYTDLAGIDELGLQFQLCHRNVLATNKLHQSSETPMIRLALYTDATGTKNDPGTEITVTVSDLAANVDMPWVKPAKTEKRTNPDTEEEETVVVEEAVPDMIQYGDTSAFETFLPKGSTLTAAERTALLTGDWCLYEAVPTEGSGRRSSTLLESDAGWWCVDPDSGHVVVWTGTAWSE